MHSETVRPICWVCLVSRVEEGRGKEHYRESIVLIEPF